jgi:N6-adenosine-specific RNA methylase IME4
VSTFSAIVPDTGEVVEFHGRQLVLPGRVTTVGLDLPPDLTFEQWNGIGAALQGVSKSVQWWIGDWLRYGERRWGEMYAQAVEDTGRSAGGLRNAKFVAEAFADLSRRRDELTWSHHAEVAGRADADELLDAAARDNLSTRELRTEVSRRKAAQAIDAPHANDDTCTVADLYRLVEQGLKFGTIYADPPWLYDNQVTRAATGNHYGGMTVEELCDLPVRELAADASHLHLWTTNAFLFECPKILDAWGFEFRSTFIWCKSQMGIGNYWRNSHEILLTAIRGDAKRFNDHSMMSWLETERGKHSAKPEQVRHMLEKASPGPRLELFGRSPADGWTVWGNQIERGLFHLDVREVA